MKAQSLTVVRKGKRFFLNTASLIHVFFHYLCIETNRRMRRSPDVCFKTMAETAFYRHSLRIYIYEI